MTELSAVKLQPELSETPKTKKKSKASSAYVAAPAAPVDWVLITLLWAIASIGIVLVTSASISIADSLYGDSLRFAKRHSVYLLLGIAVACFIASIPSTLWRRFGPLFLVLSLVLLTAVLIPGLGKRVNGSQRWFDLGFITVQASEIVKFCMIVYFASYFSRRQEDLLQGWKGFCLSIGTIGLVAGLLLIEPDFGSAVVISVSAVAMLFLAGVRLPQFSVLILLGVLGVIGMIYFSDYRMQRLVGFMDPWADQYDTGYQLTQSLIAFGRGEWFGLGLGNSIQKLFYLPEAHTDFIFAILAEELGLFGVLLVLSLYVGLIVRIFNISRRAMEQDDKFVALASFGIAAVFSTQVLINVGVASGFLPTKGLTLPFVSWGGSSLLANFALIGFLLRLDWELRTNAEQKPKISRMPRSKPKLQNKSRAAA